MKKASKVANVREREEIERRKRSQRGKGGENQNSISIPPFNSIQFNSIEGDENKNRPTNSIRIPSPSPPPHFLSLSLSLSLSIYIYMCASEFCIWMRFTGSEREREREVFRERNGELSSERGG
jgi:hypothetical protein